MRLEVRRSATGKEAWLEWNKARSWVQDAGAGTEGEVSVLQRQQRVSCSKGGSLHFQPTGLRMSGYSSLISEGLAGNHQAYTNDATSLTLPGKLNKWHGKDHARLAPSSCTAGHTTDVPCRSCLLTGYAVQNGLAEIPELQKLCACRAGQLTALLLPSKC